MNKYRTADGSKLTPAQIARLEEIEARIGDQDDFPLAPEVNWASAVQGRFFQSKEAVSIRLYPDVADWLRRKGPDYQTAVNRLLREKMSSEA